MSSSTGRADVSDMRVKREAEGVPEAVLARADEIVADLGPHMWTGAVYSLAVRIAALELRVAGLESIG